MLELEDLQIVAFSQGVDYAQSHCNKDDASCGGLFINTYSTFYEPIYYAGMSPILCIGWNDGGESCMLQVGNVLAIPLITHYSECICSEIRGNQSALEECSSVDILAGLLFYPGETVYEAPKTFDYMANMYNARKDDSTQDYVFHQNAYSAMYDLITSTYVGSDEVSAATPEHIAASFEKVCDDGCSLVVFESWDQSSFDINLYFMQVCPPYEMLMNLELYYPSLLYRCSRVRATIQLLRLKIFRTCLFFHLLNLRKSIISAR